MFCMAFYMKKFSQSPFVGLTMTLLHPSKYQAYRVETLIKVRSARLVLSPLSSRSAAPCLRLMSQRSVLLGISFALLIFTESSPGDTKIPRKFGYSQHAARIKAENATPRNFNYRIFESQSYAPLWSAQVATNTLKREDKVEFTLQSFCYFYFFELAEGVGGGVD